MDEPDQSPTLYNPFTGKYEVVKKINRTDTDWQRILTPDQFRVARQKGTEPAFSGAYHDFHDMGFYACVCCGTALFRSDDKFESGTGWPSFTAPVAPENIYSLPDTSYGMMRTEVLCARCDAHLGHVFDDGPPPAKTRYCMNSASLKFIPFP